MEFLHEIDLPYLYRAKLFLPLGEQTEEVGETLGW